MKPYFSLFRMRFINTLQYRTAAVAGMATQFTWGSMEVLLFRTFYKSGSSQFPMAFEDLSSYIWLQQAFLALYLVWFWENELFQSITTGDVAYELCRPVRLYHMWFARGLAVRLAKAVLRCMPVLIFASLLPAPYGLTLPPDLKTAGLALLSMCLGLFVTVAFGMLVYMSVFYMISSQGIKLIMTTVSEFLSGAVIPLPFLPQRLRIFAELLPFASMQNAPFRIYSGDISGSYIYRTLLLQVFWLLALTLIGMQMEKNALKRIVIQGG